MAEIICVRMNWDNKAIPIRIPGAFYTLHVDPSSAFPFGQKGMVLAGAWKQLDPDNKMDGMLIIDGDVAIDPLDLSNMLAAIHHHDKMVVVAPARIFPISTKRSEWSWAHWSVKASKEMETKNIRWFSFNFTYLPRRVIEQALTDNLVAWTYPSVDKRMSDAAFKAGVGVYVAESVYPKHLNF
jgi:hypothetical protein